MHTQLPRFSIAVLLALALPLLAMAQGGTIDLSRVKTTGQILIALALWCAAAVCVVVIAYGLLKIRGHDHASGILAVVGGIVAAIVVGYAIQWVNAISGQSVQASGF